MKKGKWLNYISILALAVCVMVIGVYSAKLISLESGGRVGFDPHSTKAVVSATISNAMRGKEYEFVPVATGTSAVNPAWKDSFTTEDGVAGITDADYLTEDSEWNFGDIYFDDVNIPDGEAIKPVIFTFTITNYSEFAIKASISEPTVSGVTVTAKNVNYIAPYEEGSEAPHATVTLTFALNNTTSSLALTDIEPVLTLNTSDIKASEAVEATEDGWWGYVDGTNFVVTSKPDSVSDTNIQVPSHIKFEGEIYPTIVTQTKNEEHYEEYYRIENNIITGVNSYSNPSLIEIDNKTTLYIPALIKLNDGSIVAIKEIGNGNMPVFKSFSEADYKGNLVISRGIQKINAWAFGANNGVSEVVLPSTVTQIGASAFSGDQTLEKINLKNVTSIGYNSFNGCSSLQSVDIRNVLGVTDMDNAPFIGCTALQSVICNGFTNLHVGFNYIGVEPTYLVVPEGVVCDANCPAYICNNYQETTTEQTTAYEGEIPTGYKLYISRSSVN